MKRLGYYIRRPGYFLSIAYYDVPLRLILGILAIKLLFFTYITGHQLEIFFASFGILMAVSSFSLLIKRNVLKFLYLYSINVLFSLSLLVHSLYLKYFDDFASLYYLKQIHQVVAVSDVILGMVGKELLFIVDLIVLPFLFCRFKKATTYSIQDKLKAVIMLILLCPILNMYPIMYHMRTSDNFFKSVYHRGGFVRYTGIIVYQIVDLYYVLLTQKQKMQILPSDVQLVTDWKRQDIQETDKKLTGTGKGKNLIVIQVESLQNFVIGRSHHGKEVTPNLNRLAKEGIYFNNIYDQTAAGNSSDATFLANCSLYPSRKGAVSFLYPQNDFFCMPKVLEESGYTSAVMHAYKKSFWNSDIFERSIGFKYQFYEDSYVITDRLGGKLKGLSDKSFFLQSMGQIKQIPTPFYVFLRTLSTHALFDHITKDIDDFPLDDLEGELIGDYIRAMHYVDSAIGEFLEKINKNNLASNMMIVVYGDHRARLPSQEMKRIGVYDMSEKRKIPLIIYIPDKKLDIESDTIGGLIDVAPTLCNILGIDISHKLFMGRDLLNSRESFVIFRDGSYMSENNSIDRTSALEQLKVSDLILEKDMVHIISTKGRGNL